MSKEVMQMALDALIDLNEISKNGIALPAEIDAAIEELRTALAQPEPEPVAWMYKGEPWFDGKLWNDKIEVTKDKIVAMFKDKNAKPLYAEPPQREWVGLTSEEIREGNRESWVTTQAWESAVWWAEAKLKEKNT